MNAAEHYTTRYLEPKDLDQYNALLRYTFQVTEEELTATGWKDDEIKQSKFPVLERADVLGCFDGEDLISQFAVYPLKMNMASLMFRPSSSMVRRSTPRPKPPCGGQPYLKNSR